MPTKFRKIYEAAATIDERLAAHGFSQCAEESSAQTASRITKWLRWCANGDMDLFRKRLEADSVAVWELPQLLGSKLDAGLDLQATWVQAAPWIINALNSPAPCSAIHRCTRKHKPIPFEPLFVPLVCQATERAGIRYAVFRKPAIAALQRRLLLTLSRLSSEILYRNFSLFRHFEGGDSRHSRSSTDVFYCYLAALRSGELLKLLTNYPVLTRLICLAVTQWIEVTNEFSDRLAADLPALAAAFNKGGDLGKVSEVRAGLSESHSGGRTVWKVSFSCGVDVAYKPRSLDPDEAWRKLLDWLSANDAPFLCGAARVVPRSGYGWSEWIPAKDCRDLSEARRFYKRAGSMLCLLHILGGCDFHEENIIANGSIPYPVDLETLLQPVHAIDESYYGTDQTATAVAARRLRSSVLATQYLPFWAILPGRNLVKAGGLNPGNLQRQFSQTFAAVNTDAMRMALEISESSIRCSRNLPYLRGKPVLPGAHAEDLKEGYSSMYEFVLLHRGQLFREEGPFARLRGVVTRVILRPTSLYNELLLQSLRGSSLSSGIDWSIHFEYLHRWCGYPYCKDKDHSRIARDERRSLSQLDIPRFVVSSASRNLELSASGELKSYFFQTGYDALKARVAALGPVHLQHQLDLIELSVGELSCTDRMRPEQSVQVAGKTELAFDPLEIAVEIGSVIESEACISGNEAAWLGAVLLSTESKAQLEVVGHGLYAGNAGIALYLASLYRITREKRFWKLAMRALGGIRQDILDTGMVATLDIGGASGLSSLVFAYARCGRLLEVEEYLDTAKSLALQLTDGRIAGDNAFDVMLGAAGAVLGLLALHHESRDEFVLDRARACGQHLAAAQQRTESPGRSWPTIDGRFLAGMSHGAAGISLAMAKLYAATDDKLFLDSAANCISFENSLFVSKFRNWPDLRRGERSAVYSRQWCHGSAGIGLARLGCYNAYNEPFLLDDVQRAIAATRHSDLLANDSLCCGNSGVLEFFLEAGRLLELPDLTLQAYRIAEQVVQHARQDGRYRWRFGPDRLNPSLYTGIAGLGYELLRLAQPKSIPSVVLWE